MMAIAMREIFLIYYSHRNETALASLIAISGHKKSQFAWSTPSNDPCYRFIILDTQGSYQLITVHSRLNRYYSLVHVRCNFCNFYEMIVPTFWTFHKIIWPAESAEARTSCCSSPSMGKEQKVSNIFMKHV